MRAKTAIVVGGGAAGASAAFRLKRAGAEVTLIERASRVGGRTRTERMDGYIVDVGAGLLPGTYKAVHSLIEDAGMGEALEPMTAPTAIVRDGRLHHLHMDNMIGSMLSTKLFGLRAKADLPKLFLKRLSMGHSLNFEDLGRAARFDTESIADYARRSLAPDLFEYLINPLEKTLYACKSSDASVVDIFWSLKCLLSPKAHCIKGGMDQLVTQVSQHFAVRTLTTAVSVTEVAGAVEVAMVGADGAECVEKADICVIATPARDVPAIDRGLGPASRRFLEKTRYSSIGYLHLRLRQRPAEPAAIIMVPDPVESEMFCALMLDHNAGSDRVPSGKGGLGIYFSDRWSRRIADWSDEEVCRSTLLEVERILPGIAELVEGHYIHRWDWAATLSHPGYWKEVAEFSAGLDLQRRVQLAGDYFSLASINSAVTSGKLAADRLAARYL